MTLYVAGDSFATVDKNQSSEGIVQSIIAPLVQLDQNATLRTLRSEVRILQGAPSHSSSVGRATD